MNAAGNPEPTVEPFPGVTLAVVYRKAAQLELKDVIPPACGLVFDAVKQANQPGVGRLVAVYRGREGEVMDVAVGVEVQGPVLAAGEVGELRLPACRVLTMTHFGSYAGLKDAFARLHAFAEKNSIAITWPTWETYGHWQPHWNADPSLIRTDVSYALRD